MSVDFRLLGEFAAELYSTDSFEKRFTIYDKYLKKLGFQGASYTFIPRVTVEGDLKTIPAFSCSDTFSPEFLDHYTSGRLDQNDFTIRRSFELMETNQLPIWDWQEVLNGETQEVLLSSEEEVIRLAKADYEINNALSIPTMNDSLGLAGFSIISRDDDQQFQLLKKEKLETLKIMSRQFHDACLSSQNLPPTFIKSFLEKLTPLEADLLRHLARDLNLQRYEKVSYKRAGNVLSELRQRLGIRSQHRLMYLAGVFRLLDQ